MANIQLSGQAIEQIAKERKERVRAKRDASISDLSIQIPDDLLQLLKTASKRRQALRKVANLLSDSNNHDISWNMVIDYLDRHHPGWRGYEVRYPDGRIC